MAWDEPFTNNNINTKKVKCDAMNIVCVCVCVCVCGEREREREREDTME